MSGLFRNTVLIFLLVALVLVGGRLARWHFDASYFITAGSDFVDGAHTPAPVAVQPGQGYDGQFFYRYALAPADFRQDGHGVHVDHPGYRVQRIGYPLLAWLAAIGGMAPLVPDMLILVNLLAFVGIGFYAMKLVRLVGADGVMALLPLCLCGVYMSLARDLAEVTELFFFTGTVYYLFRQRYMSMALMAAMTILCRETSMIALAPLLVVAMIQQNKEGKLSMLPLCVLPFIVYGAWRIVIYINIPAVADSAAGYGQLGLPFAGIIKGLTANLNWSDAHHILQLVFWLVYFCWQVVFVAVVFGRVSFRNVLQADTVSSLKLAWLCWLPFAVCFSDSIYCDDWGFVRIFSLWNMCGILLLAANKQRMPKWFNIVSALPVVMTIARLIVTV